MKRIVLIGRPNVGKSSLFNALLGFRRSIVVDQPGTTLDLISEKMTFANAELIDSQGVFGEGDSAILREALLLADAVIFVVDATTGVTPFDSWIAKELYMMKLPVLLAINKVEAKGAYTESEFSKLHFDERVTLSVAHRTNIDFVKEWCVEFAGVKEAGDKENEPISIALVGRPNTGKSTLMNLLCQKTVSKVSPIPLTTRDPVSFDLHKGEDAIELIDTAGMRRPRAKKDLIENYSIHATTRTIRKSDVVLLLINSSEAITDQDMRLLSLLEREGRPALVLFNFWDKLDHNQRRDFVANSDFSRYLASFTTLPISAKTGFQTDRILRQAARIYKKSNTRIKTSKLNKIVETLLINNPPPAAGRGNFNIMYASQVKVDPPCFIFWLNRKTNLPEHYRNYMINQLRERLGLQSQALKVFFREE